MPSEPDLTLRPATLEDVEPLATLYLTAREAAYPSIPRSVHPASQVRQWFRGRFDTPGTEVWLAARDDVPVGLLLLEDDDVIGCLRVLDDGDWARIGRVAVAQPARGRGLADVLMVEAMAVCGDREVRLDAQTGLTAFYAGYGFEVTGPEFDEDGVMHVPMAREGRPSTL